MTTPEQPISPRGVPQIRVDWLVDVARRLARTGLAGLRAIPEDDRLRLTDEVDGRPWTFEVFKLSAVHATAVDFDADLWAPDDAGGKPTLRAGFSLAPRWDDAEGRTALVRVEIGPRGAVTFDPENWMVTIPLESDAGASPAGVVAGTWAHLSAEPAVPVIDAATDARSATALAGLVGRRLDLADLAPILDGDLVPELLLTAREPQAKSGGMLGRLLGRKADEAAPVVVSLRADGPLSAAWTGATDAADLTDDGLSLGDQPPERHGEELTFRTDSGVLTLVGRGLQVSVS